MKRFFILLAVLLAPIEAMAELRSNVRLFSFFIGIFGRILTLAGLFIFVWGAGRYFLSAKDVGIAERRGATAMLWGGITVIIMLVIWSGIAFLNRRNTSQYNELIPGAPLSGVLVQ